jgi:hypothetical protein
MRRSRRSGARMPRRSISIKREASAHSCRRPRGAIPGEGGARLDCHGCSLSTARNSSRWRAGRDIAPAPEHDNFLPGLLMCSMFVLAALPEPSRRIAYGAAPQDDLAGWSVILSREPGIPEKAAQGPENIDSTPENGMVSVAPNPKIWYEETWPQLRSPQVRTRTKVRIRDPRWSRCPADDRKGMGAPSRHIPSTGARSCESPTPSASRRGVRGSDGAGRPETQRRRDAEKAPNPLKTLRRKQNWASPVAVRRP